MTWGEVKEVCKDVPAEALMRYGYVDEHNNELEFIACGVNISKHYSADDGIETWVVEIR